MNVNNAQNISMATELFLKKLTGTINLNYWILIVVIIFFFFFFGEITEPL